MKKQTRLFLITILMICSVGVFAQKPFAGSITFETTAEGCTDPNITAMLAEQVEKYVVMGNNTRMDISIMIADVTNIFNGTNKTFTQIISIPAFGKYYVELTEDKIKETFKNIKFDYNYTEETKTIANYTCKKVIITITDLESDEEESAVAWVTNDLGLGEDINFMDFPGLKGYPLCTEIKKEINGEEVTVQKTATSIVPDKKVKPTAFMRPSDALDIKEAPAEVKQMLQIKDEE